MLGDVGAVPRVSAKPAVTPDGAAVFTLPVNVAPAVWTNSTVWLFSRAKSPNCVGLEFSATHISPLDNTVGGVPVGVILNPERLAVAAAVTNPPVNTAPLKEA